MPLHWLRDHNEKFRTAFRWLCRVWRFYSNLAGVAVLAMALSYLLVVGVTEEQGLVFEHHPNISPRLETPVIKRGEKLKYVVHTRMNESCPGEILTIYSSVGKVPAVITTRRTITRSDLGEFRNFSAEVGLPESIYPGEWLVTVEADSQCPLRQVKSPIAKFKITVVP